MANITDSNADTIKDKYTVFGGNNSPQMKRIKSAPTANTDLAEWNSEYTSLPQFFGDTITFFDFSLPGKSWQGYISIEDDLTSLPFSGNHECVIEELVIHSVYDHKIQKNVGKSWVHT